MFQNSLSAQFRRLRLKHALSELERIQQKIETELNQSDQTFYSHELTTGLQRAKEIMGDNMISIEDVAQTFGVEFSIEQITQLIENTYYEQTLQNCKDTHILFPGYPITICELSYKKPDLLICDCDCREGFWYDYKDFIYKDTTRCRWYLVKKDLIFNNPRPQINDNEEMLSPVEIIFMIVLYHQVNNIKIFSNAYLRCFKKDDRLGGELFSNAYIDTFNPAIKIFHPFNYQSVSPRAIVISRKVSYLH
jgi:hypothetical protein